MDVRSGGGPGAGSGNGSHRTRAWNTASWILLAAGLLLAAIPMGLVAHHLFGASLRAYLPLAPLATLAFFLRPGRRKVSPDRRSLILFAPGTILVLAGLTLGRPGLLWIGSYWNILAVCALGGVVFAFPAPLLIFAVPPLAPFLSILAGFSLRIWLSSVAAHLLQILDADAAATGNIIVFHGESFIVDRVCEGMKMAVATFLVASVLARFSSSRGRGLILLITLPLWLSANLLRILSLIFFRLPAGSIGHESAGLAFFAGMILFPLAIVSLAFSARPPKAEPVMPGNPRVRGFALAVLAATAMLSLLNPSTHRSSAPWPVQIQGFARERSGPEPDVAIFRRKDDSLILKRNLFAPGTAHDPRICFEAAGFTMREESEEAIGTFRIRSAKVEKDGHTARLLWWYAWGKERSSSDMDWRIARLRQREVVQVNLYGRDDADLRETARILLQMNVQNTHVAGD